MGYLQRLLAQDVNGKLQIEARRVPLLLAVIDLDSLTDDLIEQAVAQPPEVLLKLVVGWLGQRAVMTEKAETNRTKILSLGPAIEHAQITDNDILPIVNSWMYCSYAEVSVKKPDQKLF